MYDIGGYGAMIADSTRTDAYREALHRTVRPDSVVVDIGAGTGIFALLACQLGARRVYAIEPSDYVQAAVEIARENGYQDRITFLQLDSKSVELDELAHVVVSDTRGVLPLFGRHVETMIDARSRLLAVGGRLIPASDRLFAAVVSSREDYERIRQPWIDRPHELAMNAAMDLALNRMHKVELREEHLVTPPALWAELDYTAVRGANFSAPLSWDVAAGAEAHGIVVWFDAELSEGVGFSAAPGERQLIYGQAFFPWLQPVVLERGDRVKVHLRANLVQEDYQWVWRSNVTRGGVETCRFQQSTFLGQPLSRAQLARASTAHVPRLTASGEVARVALELMNGSCDLEAIAKHTAEQFPDRFPDWQTAFREIADLARSYAR